MDPQIIIAKPCYESWNKMTPEEKGRHCAVCSKVVKDFTSMKTEEIVNSLKTAEGEVCGRINVKELTPANKKQKVYFWVNGVLFRKAIYPIMALLGMTFVSKKLVAQNHDQRLKGKIKVSDYHTSSKKITLVIKTSYGNNTIPNAHIRILSGIKNQPEALITDENGRVSLNVEARDLGAELIEIEIAAIGFENKLTKINIVKDIQTIEIKMEEEMMILGQMIYVPDKETPQLNLVDEKDSMEKIEVTACSISTIQSLPQLTEELLNINHIEPADTSDTDEPEATDIKTASNTDQELARSTFNVFPVPSYDYVNIVSDNSEIFNLDIFDATGKKIHTVMNSNSRYSLDVSNYAAGAYYILLSMDGKAVETKKILVNR